MRGKQKKTGQWRMRYIPTYIYNKIRGKGKERKILRRNGSLGQVDIYLLANYTYPMLKLQLHKWEKKKHKCLFQN